MISLILTPVAVVAVTFAVVVSVRVAAIWYTGDDRQKARAAGFWPIARGVTFSTGHRWWTRTRGNCQAVWGRVMAWWERRASEAPAAQAGPAGPLPPPRRRAAPAASSPAGPATVPGAPLAPVPPDWGQVATRIADHEPEDDAAFIDHMRREASGLLAVAEAIHARGETLMTTVRVDPSIVHANLALADLVGECASGASGVHRQLLAVYGEIKGRIANGLILPHDGDFLTGSEG